MYMEIIAVSKIHSKKMTLIHEMQVHHIQLCIYIYTNIDQECMYRYICLLLILNVYIIQQNLYRSMLYHLKYSLHTAHDT